MLTLLVLLGLPVAAGALLAQDRYVRSSASRDELSMLALVMRITGLILATAGVAVILLAALGDDLLAGNDFLDVLLRIGAGGYGLLAILTAVIGPAFRSPRDPSYLREELRDEQRASLARLLEWIVLLMPLLPLLPILAFIAPLVLTTTLAAWGAVHRGSQISLLWRLAIASENHLPYADEVDSAVPSAGRSGRESLVALANRLRDGQPLSEAIGSRSSLLPRGDVLQIRATEGTAALPGTLRESARRSVAQLTELREGGSSIPLQAYVLNVAVIVMIVLIYLMVFIVPKMKAMFEDSGDGRGLGIRFPWTTQRLVELADDARTYWFLVGPVLCIPVVILLGPPLVTLAGWENLNFPILMRWFPRRDAPEVLRLLAAIVESGRPLGSSLGDIAAHHPRDDIRKRLLAVASHFEGGDPCWAALVRQGFLNRSEAAALDAAMANGHLSWALKSMADGIEQKQSNRNAWMVELQRPALIACLGLVVAFIALAMFTPLISTLELLERQMDVSRVGGQP
jgi:type II secretory pathway component PulF